MNKLIVILSMLSMFLFAGCARNIQPSTPQSSQQAFTKEQCKCDKVLYKIWNSSKNAFEYLTSEEVQKRMSDAYDKVGHTFKEVINSITDDSKESK